MDEWLELYDHQYQSIYYYNKLTGATQWENPRVREVQTQVNLDEEDGGYNSAEEGSRVSQENQSFHSLSDHETRSGHSSSSSGHIHEDSSGSHGIHTEGSSIDDSRDQNSLESSSYDHSSDIEGDEYDVDTYTETNDDNNFHRNNDGYVSDEYDYSIIRGHKKHDYLDYAAKYKEQRPYMDRYKKIICVLCLRGECQDVFFPCEHRCICRKCIKSHHIEEYQSTHIVNKKSKLSRTNSSNSLSCNCPICGVIIQKIFANERYAERDKYWDWVYQNPPPLSDNFMKQFKHTESVLTEVYIEGSNNTPRKSNVCIIS